MSLVIDFLENIFSPCNSRSLRGRFFLLCASLMMMVVGFFAGFAQEAQAAGRYDTMYKGELVGEIPLVSLQPNKQTSVSIQFKNTGTEPWLNNGKKYVSMYTDPSTRASLFSYREWFGKGQPVLMKEIKVAPGEIGTFILPLQAPGKIGEYQEKMKVGVENVAWIKGTYFTIPISVTETPVVEQKKVNDLSAKVLLRSHQTLETPGGITTMVRFGIKNAGPRAWKQIRLVEPGLGLATAEITSIFHDSLWPEGRVALALGEQEFTTGKMALIDVPVRAPKEVGTYTLQLQLTSEGEQVEGGLIELPVTVTTPAPEEIAGQVLPVIEPWRGKLEPRFRVGVGSVPDAAMVEVNSAYRIVDGAGQNFGSMDPSMGAEWFYDPTSKMQTFSVNGAVHTTNSYFRLEPVDPAIGVVTISSIEDKAKWNSSINYNQFRDTIEMRRNDVGFTWMVNELPIESYVKGLAEVSNSWPIEMHKAQIIAARTYAMYYHERGGKHQTSGSSYTINSSSYDQVYKGYAAEQHNANVVRAAEMTRGEVVRYNGEIAMTTYFARSDGTTRAWTEVWGGSTKPYLVARDAPYDRAKGNVRWGHGVGMSQTDGAMRADAGFLYPEILKSYYTDVTIDRLYE